MDIVDIGMSNGSTADLVQFEPEPIQILSKIKVNLSLSTIP
jgi:hypothetical protein